MLPDRVGDGDVGDGLPTQHPEVVLKRHGAVAPQRGYGGPGKAPEPLNREAVPSVVAGEKRAVGIEDVGVRDVRQRGLSHDEESGNADDDGPVADP